MESIIDTMGGKERLFIYIFFTIHVFGFGAAGFLLSYGEEDLSSTFAMGGFAIFVYLVFYFVIFGWEDIKRMFINALIGIFGIYAWMGDILSLFDKNIDNFSRQYHIVPGVFFVIYTFLLRHALIDLSQSLFSKKYGKEYGEKIGNGFFIGLGIASSLIALL
ncbi:hypothetical protein K9M48_04215 [Candidatus Gracilibacteria bacterium]|nr:hypothetical protein [Candidatus Gracilibacteria bacterium]